MAGAVEYGTARRLSATFHDFPVFGKTGTCSNNGTGWLVRVLCGFTLGRLVTSSSSRRPATFGPRAAELTGAFYKNLSDRNYFANKTQQTAQVAGLRIQLSPAAPSFPHPSRERSSFRA